MKKNLIKICSLMFCMALFLTGCATVSDVYQNGKSIYFEDVAYYQGQVALVGDYLYYGNGYADVSAEGFKYSTSAKTGYLARLNVSGDFSYASDVEDKANSSPKGVEKVNGKLVGYTNQNMFALGSYLYFTSANTHKTDSLENDYTQISIFRVKFNGDGFEELGTFKNDSSSILSVVKDNGSYYYLITAPADDSKIDVYSIKIGNKLGRKKLIIDDAESVALCDSNSTEKVVLYTEDSTVLRDGTDCVKSVSLDGKTIKDVDYGVSKTAITLISRVGDEVFYSYEENAVKEVKHVEVKGTANFSGGATFHSAEKINDVEAVEEGYIFIPESSKSLMYKEGFNQDPALLLTTSNYSDVLFVDGEYVYYSNSTSISRISVRTKEIETIVTMTEIISGQCGYVGGYIYFYATLENQDEDSTDANHYMYRTDKLGNYELVSKVK